MPEEDLLRFTEHGSFIRNALEGISDQFKEYNRGFGIAYQLGCLAKGWIKSKKLDVYTRLFEPVIDGNLDFMNVKFNYLNTNPEIKLEEQEHEAM